MIVTAIIGAGVATAYVLLGTVRFRVATAAVLRYAEILGVPEEVPSWLPNRARGWFAPAFRLSVRLFFLGCAFTHYEISAHALAGDLPPDYAEWSHQIVMFLQGVGAWIFVATLTVVDDALREV